MLALPYELIHKVLEFVEPKEIINLYETSKSAKLELKEMIKNTNFIIECKTIISDEDVEWFKTNNINIKLLEYHKTTLEGGKFWYKNGKLHRDDDIPAVIYVNGIIRKWYKNGLKHRDNDLPAIIYSSGIQFWYKNDLLHRDNDLPSLINSNGDQFWYKNDLLHRDNDLPAVIYSNGSQYWYKNGLKHRDNDLPAVIYSNGFQYWYKNGVKYR